MAAIRLNHDAFQEYDVVQYYRTRALQLAFVGYRWAGYFDYFQEAQTYTTYFTNRESKVFCSVFVREGARGAGNFARAYKHMDECPIVTVADCNVEHYLKRHEIEYHMPATPSDWPEYKAIQAYYGDRRARRSGVLLMNHIDEGLLIMRRQYESRTWNGHADIGKLSQDQFIDACKAFCLHPLLQDADPQHMFLEPLLADSNISSRVIAYAMEYRNIANAYLSPRIINGICDIELGSVPAVLLMLMGDKIQNYKDFLLHHACSHARASELNQYFTNWLIRLGISQATFATDVQYLNSLEHPHAPVITRNL